MTSLKPSYRRASQLKYLAEVKLFPTGFVTFYLDYSTYNSSIA